MKWTNRLGKWLLVGGAWSATALTLGAAGTGCLSRPVGQQPPTTKVNFTSTLSQQAVDKVDLLFAIDNSSSMGDKQAILAQAVPDLINGLLRPRCVNDKGEPSPGGETADATLDEANRFGCPENFKPEFKPVIDMHIGVVSSSLGNFGGDVCPVNSARMNDRAHLLNINPAGGEVELAKPGNFLAWYPKDPTTEEERKRHPVPSNPIRTIDGDAGLAKNFGDLVVGVGQDGCGLEAQLESVYRFLIQPDPWKEVVLDPPKDDKARQANLGEDIDIELLQQRADFLRPDSLVAIIMLTDEDDSSADPLALNGQGWAFMNKAFPGSKVARADGNGTTAPRGTSVCETDPGSPDCTSCAFQKGCDKSDPGCQKLAADKNCMTPGSDKEQGPGSNGYYGPVDDSLNVRFHRMKERYGIDPQYPISRYVNGFTQFKVPDRSTEHVIKDNADGTREIGGYVGTPKCTNPLFAAQLPRKENDPICELKRGTRGPDLVFFAVVGGVPHQLLHFDPNDMEKSRITEKDWEGILGRAPEKFDFTGIDAHMVQSVAPRTALGLGGADKPFGDNGTDPYHGREWNTDKGDLQYACTFDLPESMQRQCEATDNSCDCAPSDSLNPPLCSTGNKQVKAKAYPTVREFRVVRALGEQGIISSLCPIQLTDEKLPTYGYRPAVATIIDRLKNALTTQCLPQKLREDSAAAAPVPCLVLAQLSEPTDSCEAHGLSAPKKEILDVFLAQKRAESGELGEDGLDLAALPVCEVPQQTVERGVSCASSQEIAWCYVENDPAAGKAPAGRCPQAVIFSSGSDKLPNARFSLQCIQQFAAGEAAKDQQQ